MFGGGHGSLAAEKQKPKDVGQTMARLLVYLKPFGFVLLGAMLLIILNTVCGVLALG